ncbi:MAG: DMT family transporter [Methylococcaceae bacterium]
MEATKPSPQRLPLLGYSLVLLGALGFSAKAIFIKLAYANSANLDAISLMALRMLFSLPFFLAVACWQRVKSAGSPLSLKQAGGIISLGLMGYYIASYFDFLGLQLISAGLERLILFLYPTFVVMFSALLFKRAINAWVWLSLVLSYSGMLLVFIEQISLQVSGLFLGSSFVLASALVFSFFIMGSGLMVHDIGSARFTAYSMTVACIATLLHFVCLHGLNLLDFSPQVYGLSLLMAIFSTVLPTFFMNAGIHRIGAEPAAIISNTGPIATLGLAYIFLNEAITLVQLSGTLLVLAGVYLVSRVKS